MTSARFVALSVTILATLSGVGCKKKQAVPAKMTPAETAGSIAALSSTAGSSNGIQHFSLPRPDKNISIEGGEKSFAHVTFKPAVKIFELADLQASLQGISSDSQGLVFKNASPAIKALATGDILFVKNEMAAKVLGNVTDGDTTLVLITEARLRDVVQDGEINIEAPVRFHGPKAAELAPHAPGLLDRLVPPVYAAQSGLPGSVYDNARSEGNKQAAGQVASNIGNAITDGWKIITWSASAGDGSLNFQAVMSKNVNGFVAMVGMKGNVGNTDYITDIQFNGGAGILKKGFQGIKKTNGNIQFDWEIGKSTAGGWTQLDKIKLPAAVSVPLAPLLGGMPLTLNVSSALLIHPLLTGGSEYSRGGFAVSWGNGNLETSSSGVVQTTADSSDSMESKYEITSDAGISGVSPTAMVISYCVPRFELSFAVLGKLADSVSQLGSGIDSIKSRMMSLMPASVQAAVAASPLSGVTASNILASNADIYLQFVITEGETRSANISPMPCSKKQIKFDVDAGGDAQLFGLTPGASTSTNLFTKEYIRWDPGSDFCKGV